MRNKTKRLLTIRKLIESELISSQEELLFRLKEMNVEATQSTLSRDLKFMKVTLKFWELLQETILFLSLCAKESAEAN